MALALAALLHLPSSAGLNARPSTRKLSIRPACLASPWQRTAGRLSSLAPWQAAGPQFQVMSRAMKFSLGGRSAVGLVGRLGGVGRGGGGRRGERHCGKC